MSERPTGLSERAERWLATASGAENAPEMRADAREAARERREEAHWERLHRQIKFLPLTFLLWSLLFLVSAVVLGVILGALGIVLLPVH